MNWLPWFSSEAWIPFVKALLHTLWQGALVAALLYAFLKTVPARRSDVRYGAGVVALAAVVLGGFVTWAFFEYKRMNADAAKPSVETALVSSVPNDSMETPSSQGSREEILNVAAGPTAQAPGSEGVSLPGGARDLRRWIPWIAGVWFLGVTLMVARVMILVIGAGQLRRRSRPLDDRTVDAIVEQLRGVLAMTRRVRVAVGEHITAPAVLGVVWPTILLPASLITGVPADHLRAVLAHELAHIRRYDYLVNLGQMVVESLLFFNPMVWWISRRIRIEREACCDALAAEATGDRVEYARALSGVAQTLRPPAFAFHAVQAMAEPPESGGLLERVKRILMPGSRPDLRLPWYTIGSVLVISAIVIAALWSGSKASVTLAARILSPEERIRQLNELREAHGPSPDEEREREYSLQEDGITVSGRVITADGSPLPDVNLHVLSKRPGHTAGHSFMLENGRFSQKVNFGNVHMRASAEGYAPTFAGPLEAEPGGSIEGVELVLRHGVQGRIRLVNEAGEPLARAEVGGTYDHVNAYPGVSAATDSDGIAVFDHCSTMALKLSAGASGYQTDTRTFSFEPGETVTWTLERATPARGVVVTEDTGEPIPDAELRLLRIAGPHSHSWSAETAETIAVTDENGRFILDRLRDDSFYTFYVEAPGHGRAFLRKVMAGETDLRVELGPEIYVRGTIIGDLDKLRTRRGVKGIHYSNPYEVEEDSSYSYQEWEPIDLSGDEGHFEIRNLFATRVRIHAGGEMITRELDEPVDDLVIDLSEEAQAKAAEDSATRTVVLRFDVPDGSPLPKGELTVTYLEEQGTSRYMKPMQVLIENGEVRFTVPAPTRIGYRNTGLTGYWIKEEWSKEVAAGDGPFEMTIEAVPAGAIYGTVAEADGSPAHSSMIHVVVAERSPRMPQGSLNVDVKNSSSAEGDRVSKFMAAPLPLGGKYAIVLHRGDTFALSEPVELTEAEPMKHVDVRYTEGVTVRGQVLLPDGQPAAGMQYSRGYSSPYSHGFGGSDQYADHEGRFVLENVNPDAPGTYSLRISENAGLRPTVVKFRAGDSPLTIRLERGRVVRGVVLDDETGWPIPGMEVYAMAREYRLREPTIYIDADEKTNKNGEFTFTTLGPIEYTLDVRGGKVLKPGDAIVTGGQKEPVTLRVELAQRSKLKPRKPADAAQK